MPVDEAAVVKKIYHVDKASDLKTEDAFALAGVKEMPHEEELKKADTIAMFERDMNQVIGPDQAATEANLIRPSDAAAGGPPIAMAPSDV